MTDVTVRLLDESEWAAYRAVRLRALEESPEAFTATLAEESERDEAFWRERMTRSHRLLAERPEPVGIVSVGPYDSDPTSAECYGLYVVPEARGSGVAWKLVEAAARLATREGYHRLYYWVGTDNPRAIGFGSNAGFRVSGYRRTARTADLERGEDEMAMVMSLGVDLTVTPNAAASGTAATPSE
ncbi:GNAT family N-acetyltransferase [Microlunatus ginsengisoli]|uniref:GNAT family N-acetyltransferase n=1 Tax=Microlunatus ginsengisoli TaxID=363863 RepID=A0ABP6ZCY5_9ACTN